MLSSIVKKSWGSFQLVRHLPVERVERFEIPRSGKFRCVRGLSQQRERTSPATADCEYHRVFRAEPGHDCRRWDETESTQPIVFTPVSAETRPTVH